MVASKTSLPAGPPPWTGIFEVCRFTLSREGRGNHPSPPREGPRKWEKNQKKTGTSKFTCQWNSRAIGLGIFGLGIISSFVACSGAKTVSELDDVFLLTENVQLKTEGLGIHGCGALCVDRSSRIYLLDPSERRIFVFEPSGDLLSTLGGPGDGPGEFRFPGAAELNLLDDLFVIDIFQKRINIFNAERGFRDSLLLTGTQSQISDVRITSEGSILASGFTRVSSDNPEYGNWISRYDAKGKYLTSFFSSNEYNRNWAWRISPGCMFDIDLDDNIYAIQHCDYRIEKYDGKGNILAKFGSPSVAFVHPNTKKTFSTKGYASRSQLEADLRAFTSSWTRIIKILVIRNRYVLVVWPCQLMFATLGPSKPLQLAA